MLEADSAVYTEGAANRPTALARAYAYLGRPTSRSPHRLGGGTCPSLTRPPRVDDVLRRAAMNDVLTGRHDLAVARLTDCSAPIRVGDLSRAAPRRRSLGSARADERTSRGWSRAAADTPTCGTVRGGSPA